LYEGDLDRAVEDADMTVYVDIERPEDNGPPLFAVQCLRLIDSPSGNEVTSQIKIHLHSLIDLRDFRFTKGMVICGGRAALVKLVKIPHYRRDKGDVKALQAKETKPSANDQKAYLTWINDFKEPPTMNVLFIMPRGMIVSANLDSKDNPAADQRVPLKLNKQLCEFTTGAGANAKDREQEQTSGFWLMRITSEKAGVLQEEAEDAEDDLDAAFG
jgi:hypothetical protein